MKKGKISHVTGEHNINGNSNEALTGFQKANVNYTKTDSGMGGFLFGVMLLILFGVNAAFMLYVKHELEDIRSELVTKQTEFETSFNTEIDRVNTRITRVATSFGSN